MRTRLAWLACLPLLAGTDDSFLIRNATIFPVSGPKVDNASLLVLDGKIADIGPKLAPPKDRKGLKVIEGKGLQVYPGMIDSGTQVGLSEIGSVRETNDAAEIGRFNPQLRPLVAVNPESEHIPVVRANGITSVALMPMSSGGGFAAFGSIGMIGGQVSLMHLNGWTWEEMEIQRGAAVHLRFPTIVTRQMSFADFSMQRQNNYAEAKKNHDGQLQALREFFEQARRYQLGKQQKAAGQQVDLKLEAMIPLLEGKVPLTVMAAKEREIREAIEFAEKEKVKLILAGVERPGKAVTLIAEKKIPVILGTPLELPEEDDDPYDATFAFPAELYKAGVKFAFASFGNQFARNLPYEAAQAVAFGLPYEEGLKSVTLNPAQIWGIADQYGSIEKGKVADLMVTDGDPLEIRTQVKMLFIKGAAVDLESKHTHLYKKYMGRPN